MTDQEPLDLVILLKIVDYLIARPADGNETDHAKNQAITNIVNNISSGVTVESIFRNETRESVEVTMRDKYTTGQAGAVGPNSMAFGQTFNQIWIQAENDIDLTALADQLSQLRSKMRAASSGTPEEDVAIAELAQAEVAAKKGDGTSVMGHLANVGKSTFDIAKQIGIEIAAKAIAMSMGLPG
jgi:hypothetical protein